MASEKATSTSFSYIATNPTTGVVRGELRASGQDSALIQLERMGLEPISISEKKESILDMQINLFENEGHGFKDGKIKVEVLQKTEAFFRQYLNI